MLTTTHVHTLEDAQRALEVLGYKTKLDGVLSVQLRDTEHSFVAFMSINTSKSSLRIYCEVLELTEDVEEDRFTEFSFAALDANTRIAPFSIGILTGDDEGGSEKLPVVLTNILPLGDLSSNELESAFNSLEEALFGIKNVLSLATS
jgi:hypothetical protein